jgi:hypothetical protein
MESTIVPKNLEQELWKTELDKEISEARRLN